MPRARGGEQSGQRHAFQPVRAGHQSADADAVQTFVDRQKPGGADAGAAKSPCEDATGLDSVHACRERTEQTGLDAPDGSAGRRKSQGQLGADDVVRGGGEQSERKPVDVLQVLGANVLFKVPVRPTDLEQQRRPSGVGGLCALCVLRV